MSVSVLSTGSSQLTYGNTPEIGEESGLTPQPTSLSSNTASADQAVIVSVGQSTQADTAWALNSGYAQLGAAFQAAVSLEPTTTPPLLSLPTGTPDSTFTTNASPTTSTATSQFWLASVDLYPPGYTSQLASWEVDNLDNLAWVNSQARAEGVEWNEYFNAVKTRRAAFEAANALTNPTVPDTIDKTDANYWLKFTDVYPPGYKVSMEGWEVANLDNLAWVNSQAREWGVEWNPYQSAVTTRRAAFDATIDRTKPDYWLPDTPLYPPGYQATMAKWEVANLDNLAWVGSKAREWGVGWNPYQDAVTARRDAVEMLASPPQTSGLTDQDLANVLTQATAWGRNQTSSNQDTTPNSGTNLRTNIGTTSGSLPPLTSTNTTFGNVGPAPLSLSPTPPLTPQTVTSHTEIVKEVQPDGSVKEVERFIITATPAKNPYLELLPYGGRTGSEENFFRDMETAMSSYEERARALGMNPYAEAGELKGGDAISSNASEIIDAAYEWSPNIDIAQLLRDEVSEQYSKSIDNQILGEVGQRAARMHLEVRGLQLVEEQVRVLVTDEDGEARVRIYDFLVRDRLGNLQFIEVKANGGRRNSHQTAADNAMSTSGGMFASRKPGVAFLPRAIPPTPVDVWNISIPPTGA